MSRELMELRDKLKKEQQSLMARLKEVEGDLASVERVLQLIPVTLSVNDSQHLVSSSSPSLSFPPQNRLRNMTFKDSVTLLMRETPNKRWRPKEIARALKNDGYKSKTQDFAGLTRTMLAQLRNSGEIYGVMEGNSYLYWLKEVGPASDQSNAGPESTGGVDELA